MRAHLPWILTLVLIVAACGNGDDADPLCSEGQTRCSGDLLERCADGVWMTSADCGATGQICVDDGTPACEDTDPPLCEEDALRCTGNLLERCVSEAWQTETDCAAGGQICVDDGTPACEDDTPPNCTQDELRCNGVVLERCQSEAWVMETDCGADGRLCRDRACEALAWEQVPTLIDDPIVNGTSLMLAIDSPSFGLDPQSGLAATSFGSAYDDPSSLFLWLLDTASGDHAKLFLSGDPMPADTAFCVGGENWCQYIGFDPVDETWTVVGPSSPSLMRVDSAGVASRTATSGTRPPDSWISRMHRHDWVGNRLWEYGAVGPSGFGDGLYSLDMNSGLWSLAVAGLPQVMDNCLVVDAAAGLHYSFGGKTTTDGGETSTPLSGYTVIDAASNTHEVLDWPVELGVRRGMSCAFDLERGLVFLLGGSLVNDNWNEIENEYHNDLWVMRVSDGAFFQLMPDSEGGAFLPPDSYGDRAFEGDSAGPNFGMNQGRMIYDAGSGRLLVMGEVPIFTHGQAYWMDVSGVEDLLTP